MSTQDSWTTTAITVDLVRGAAELERTEHGWLPHRLPAWARAQCADPQLLMAESQPSGVRLSFRTSASALELDVLTTRRTVAGMPPRPQGVYDVLVDGHLAGRGSADAATTITLDPTTGTSTVDAGPVSTVRFTGLPQRVKDVEVRLPHLETTELVALRSDAPLETILVRGRRLWLHHGSSISQGTGAPSPSTTWPALAAARAGVELVNLGLSGSALLDPFTARHLRDSPADVISVAIGINLVNTDLMRLRAFGPAVHGFLDTVREGHPGTPLLVVSPIHCAIHEDAPGPSGFDLEALRAGRLRFTATGDPAERSAGKLTLRVVREELARIVEQRRERDPNLHHLDGLDLYGEADALAHPLPDALHPDADIHQEIGRRFAEHAFTADGRWRLP